MFFDVKNRWRPYSMEATIFDPKPVIVKVVELWRWPSALKNRPRHPTACRVLPLISQGVTTDKSASPSSPRTGALQEFAHLSIALADKFRNHWICRLDTHLIDPVFKAVEGDQTSRQQGQLTQHIDHHVGANCRGGTSVGARTRHLNTGLSYSLWWGVNSSKTPYENLCCTRPKKRLEAALTVALLSSRRQSAIGVAVRFFSR